MSKEVNVYLDDIINSIKNIENYVRTFDYNSFSKNNLVKDAVIRNLAVIGEAVKNIPDKIKRNYSDAEWKKIAGMRDIIIHQYSNINIEIIWDIIANKLPRLKQEIQKIKTDIERNS